MSKFSTPNFSVDLSGQVALVTGASSGLGYRFSKVLAGCGAKVALAARRVEKLEALEREIRNAGGECAVVPLDVMDRDSIRNCIDIVENQLGLINTLINNAGMVDAQWAIKQDEALIDGVIDTNLVGPYLLSNEVARKLGVDRLSETAKRFGLGKKVLSESLAVEWAKHHINVNAIAPGIFHSEMADKMLERIGDVSKGLPRKRICVPEQMDSTLLFLVSPSSECVTGTCIKIDDGQTAR